MNRKYNFALLLLMLCSSYTMAQNMPAYKVLKTFHIASGGGWDYIAVNKNKVYVSHGTQVNVLDEKTGDSIGVIPNTTGVHGIAFDNELNRGYTSNGRLNTVTAFDLNTNAIVAQIPAGQNPDAIMYEPFLKKIITNNGRGKNLSFIDPVNNTLTDSIFLDGKPEEAVSDGKGKLFVNLEDKSMIAVINLKTMKIEHLWPLAPGEGPSGLAMDVQSNRLFSSCSDSKQLIVMDAANGKIIDKLPIGEGCDGTAFDPKSKTIFAPNGGDGTITAIKEKSANDYNVVSTITTHKGARTITIDKQTGSLFLPTAEFAPADLQNPKARRQMLPGTFQVLEVGR